jgi:preprotein translocase subunit SecD
MNHNLAIFLYGLAILFLFGWYFFTDSERAKRILGSVLAVTLTALCLWLAYPPKDKIQLGLDLKGGTSFLVRLVPETVEVKSEDGTTKTEKRVITPGSDSRACPGEARGDS